MARLTGFIALFAVALLIANTYAYYTTVEVDEDNPGRSEQRCRELQGRWQLRSCERYLRQQGRDVLLLRGIDDYRREELDECCRQLRRVDERCRCSILEGIVREQQRQARGQEGRQMLQRARNLPSKCGLRPQRCDF